jgi:hypothetical protein
MSLHGLLQVSLRLLALFATIVLVVGVEIASMVGRARGSWDLDWSSKLSLTLSPLIALVVGLITIAVLYRSYISTRKSQQFLNAVHLYRRYLEIAFENPSFAEPREDDPMFVDPDGPIYRKYEWFVGILLRACDELLEHNRDSIGQWDFTIKEQLKFHKKYLKEDDWFNNGGGHNNYSKALRHRIREVVG